MLLFRLYTGMSRLSCTVEVRGQAHKEKRKERESVIAFKA